MSPPFLPSMNRIAEAFARGKAEGRSLFVAYLCAGDPDEERSYAACRALIDAGIDILELGVPFSDPLADGLTNQLAAERALASGMTQEKVFALVRRLRAESEIPITFYTYYNLVLAGGIENYVQRAKDAGVDGLLTLDLPPEEAGELLESCRRHDLKTVFIIAPTTPAARIPLIAQATTGFLYYVSREGVTGVRKDLAANLDEAVAQIRSLTDLPLAVGFGIARPDQVRTVAAMADAVVVGSVLVNCLAENASSASTIQQALGGKARELVAGLHA